MSPRNGGVWIHSKGYIWVRVPPNHPCNRAGRRNYAPLHLLVFYYAEGRLPLPGFHLHHKDEDKCNNRRENLEERGEVEHGRLHLTSERAREIGRKGGKRAARRRGVRACS